LGRPRVAIREDELPIALAFVVMLAFAGVVAPQSDTFFHLRTGAYIWQSRAIPTTEPFSHTFRGRPWANHEWLSQLVFYAAYAAGGPLLLTLLCGACVVIAVLASWTMTRGDPAIRTLFLLSLMLVTAAEWAVRPQAMSLALLMLAMWLVLRDRIEWLPLLIAAWANAHAVAVLGVVAACVNAFEAVAWSRHRRRRAMIVAASCVVAPMATPLGWHYWQRVAQTVAEARQIGIYEYRSSFADGTSFPFWLMLGALVAVLAGRVRHFSAWDRSDRLLVLVACVLAVAAVLSHRNQASFALMATPAIARLLYGPGSRKTAPLGPAGYAVLAVAVVIAAGAVAYQWRNGGAALGWRPVSPEAAAAIRNCPKPMYNQYQDGGILMWFVPEQPNFVDGRVEAYPLDFLLREWQAGAGGPYKDLLQEYGVRCAVATTGSFMARALDADATMTLRYRDQRWSVFERASGDGR
jgi:hypothetical protein